MASEDLFAEDFSEEIISELDQDYAENVEITAEEEELPIEEDEIIEESATELTEEIESTTTMTTAATVNTEGIENDTAASNVTTLPAASTTQPSASTETAKLFQLPLTRIRNIMKLDPDLNIASNESVFLVTRATELFIESLAVESYSFTAQVKKKTIQKRDVDLAISAVDSLMFLDGAMTF